MTILPIILVTLLVSSLIVLVSSSWLIIWISLEINTLSFCSIINTNTFQNNIITEPSINYFIIQSTASAVIILYLSAPSEIYGAKLLFLSGTAAILINLAASPFHSWFLEILPKVTINPGALLITWQNIAPVYLLIFIMNPVIFISIILSSIFGSITQINNTNIMEILALSSIFNISWTMLAIATSLQSLFLFLLAYWSVLLYVITILINLNINEINQNITNHLTPWLSSILMAGLGGLPPTLGFYANVQVTIQALNFSINELVTILIVISSVNLYVYLRLMSSTILFAPSNIQNHLENSWNIITPIITLNFLPLLLLTV